MPVIRINATADQPHLHGTPRSLWPVLGRHAHGAGPVIVMIHGYKYQPGHAVHCPHRHIMALQPQCLPRRGPSWPRQLGFGAGNCDEGLCIAFGWNARGALWSARRRAVQAGRALARVLEAVHRQAPDRPVHLISHSMGTEVALETLHHLPAGAVQRLLSLTGACYRHRALVALRTEAGQQAEFVNITSRENDPFDFLFERLISPPRKGDRSIGLGLQAANAVTLQLDCPGTLSRLEHLGGHIAPPDRRICHWSAYTRPGAMQFYKDLMRCEDLPLSCLRNRLPQETAPRWSRLMALPARPSLSQTMLRAG